MNILYKIYFLLPADDKFGIISKVINTVAARILKIYLDYYYPRHYKRTEIYYGLGINQIEARQQKFIVSLTSYPARINYIWICIESLLRQTFKPDTIILWLAESQFPNRILPKSLNDQMQRGLTVKWCEDLRSYKKLFYSLIEYPNDYIITVDDDVYYPPTIIETLVSSSSKYPEAICANRAHKITFDRFGKIKPYRKWKHNYNPDNMSPENNLFVTGVGGVLYPPHCLCDEAFMLNTFMTICPLADDVWWNLCALKNNTFFITNSNFNKDLICISYTQKQKLVSENVFGGGNDSQIKAVMEFLELELKP